MSRYFAMARNCLCEHQRCEAISTSRLLRSGPLPFLEMTALSAVVATQTLAMTALSAVVATQTLAMTVFSAFLFTHLVFAQTTFQSGPEQTSLVELFTSEGCSSCPPADERMSEFLNDPNLWNTFVPVSFHVDYWNGFGWEDQFSKKEFTERQRAYAKNWRSGSIYTPNFVLDGNEWKDWHRQKKWDVKKANLAGELQAQLEGDQVSVRYESPADLKAPFVVHCAILGFDLVSKVNRGENSGRKLKHDFVVLSYQKKSPQFQSKHDSNGWTARFSILDSRNKSVKKGIAIWVSQAANPAPIQVAGGYIN